jgi:transcription initiation factor TFIID subunit 5
LQAVKFHPNSNYVATGSSDKTCRLWDALKGDCVRLLTGHTGAVQALAMSPCGRYLASGGEDRNVLVWDLGSGRKIGALHGHEGMVYSLAFSADSSVLASGAADNTVRLWDVKALGGSGRSANLQLGAFPTKATPVTSVRFTRQNLLLAAGCFNPS